MEYLDTLFTILLIVIASSNVYFKNDHFSVAYGSKKHIKNKETVTFAYQFPLWKPFIKFEVNNNG